MAIGFFDGNKEDASPESIKRKRAMIARLMQTGRAPRDVGEGLNAIGQGLQAAVLGSRADAEERASNASSAEAMRGIYSGFGSPTASAGNPVATGSGATRISRGGPVDPAIRDGIATTASSLGIDPVDLATAISYETGGTFDPTKRGPTTQWGQHKGLIQFGQPQARQHGVDWNNPVGSQLGPNGAVASYLRSTGVRPGMGLLDIYSAINAGGVGRYNRSDANNGGAPGTVRDKVEQQMAGHRARALAMFQPPASQQARTAPMPNAGLADLPAPGANQSGMTVAPVQGDNAQQLLADADYYEQNGNPEAARQMRERAAMAGQSPSPDGAFQAPLDGSQPDPLRDMFSARGVGFADNEAETQGFEARMAQEQAGVPMPDPSQVQTVAITPNAQNADDVFSPVPMGIGANPFVPRNMAPPADVAAPGAETAAVSPRMVTAPMPPPRPADLRAQSPLVPQAMRQPITPMEAGENSGGAMQFIESEFARREGRPDPRSAIGAPPAQIYNAFVPQAPQMPAGGGSMPMGGAPAAQAPAQANSRIAELASIAGNPMVRPEVRQLAMAEIQTERAMAQAEADRARVQADNVRAARAAGIDENLLANPVIGKAATEAKFREAPETFRNLTPAERLQNNIDPNDRRPYQISNKTGKVSGVGGTQIFNNMRTEGAIQPGYRAVRDPQGNVERIEPIPGSQQERDIKEAEEKKGKSTAQDARYANVIFRSVADIDQNMKGSWFPTTGSIGQALSGVAGTNAHNVARAIEAIKANIGFERLSAMRAASPTGGALGGIAVKELDLLTASAGNLEQSQSADQFRRNLERLRSDFEMVIHGRTFSPEERKRMAASEAAQADQGRARPNFIDQNAARPQPTPAQSSAALQNARKAIADGAPREAVMDRLRQAGIDPGGL